MRPRAAPISPSVPLHSYNESELPRYRAAQYSKINLDIVLSWLDIRDNNRYNIYIQFSIQYQDGGVKNVKNLVFDN